METECDSSGPSKSRSSSQLSTACKAMAPARRRSECTVLQGLPLKGRSCVLCSGALRRLEVGRRSQGNNGRQRPDALVPRVMHNPNAAHSNRSMKLTTVISLHFVVCFLSIYDNTNIESFKSVSVLPVALSFSSASRAKRRVRRVILPLSEGSPFPASERVSIWLLIAPDSGQTFAIFVS